MLFLSTNGCYVGGGRPAKIITFMLELEWLWLIDSTKSGLVRSSGSSRQSEYNIFLQSVLIDTESINISIVLGYYHQTYEVFSIYYIHI